MNISDGITAEATAFAPATDGYPYPQLQLKNQLCFPLYACARKITNAYTPYLRPLGLTYTQYIVLMVLWEQKSATVGSLGATLHLDSGTLTPLLKKMESAGYITRSRCRDDERVVAIEPTEEGMALREKLKDIPLAVSSCVRLSPDEASSLYRILYEILES